MSVRKMNKWIHLEVLEPISDGGGGYTDTWRPIWEGWAERQPPKPRDITMAQQNTFTLTHVFRIRHTDRIDRSMRFREGERIFQILSYHADDPRERYLKVYCQEGPLTDEGEI